MSDLVTRDAYLLFLQKKATRSASGGLAIDAADDASMQKQAEAEASRQADAAASTAKAMADREAAVASREAAAASREAVSATAGGTAEAIADREVRRLQKQFDKDKATKEKARIAAARKDPDKAEVDAKAERRVIPEVETEAARLARWELYGVPDTASEAETSANEGDSTGVPTAHAFYRPFGQQPDSHSPAMM